MCNVFIVKKVVKRSQVAESLEIHSGKLYFFSSPVAPKCSTVCKHLTQAPDSTKRLLKLAFSITFSLLCYFSGINIKSMRQLAPRASDDTDQERLKTGQQ